MMDLFILVIVLMTGLMAGVYFVFSVVIMRSLARLPDNEGANAMNSINDVIVKTSFLPLFFVSTIAHLALLIWSLINEGFGSAYFWASLVYVMGMFGVTLVGNVPLNNQLKASAIDQTQLAENWLIYTKKWTRLNHVRTLCCTCSLALLWLGSAGT